MARKLNFQEDKTMPKYNVTVAFTKHKEISVFAKDEEAAKEKAEEIVSAWDGVEDCEVVDCDLA